MDNIQLCIDNAAASMKMEGFHVSEENKELCKKVLQGEITFEEYLKLVVAKVKGQE